ncbi:MAG: sodium:solute symporter [Candidatus Latescibacteria bacterium]|nr:sodium:solute symporter [Candidatus Latescibacterota bacterium]
MHWIDWTILIVLIGFITAVAVSTKKYMLSVADFLSANRCAGKYLLGVADGISGLGAISIIALFEMNYKAGFTASWWKLMLLPIGVIIASTGWIQYRFRQTRALTMAQFFELRYSRSFRVFAGVMGYISGLINFGIFPAVGGRFFQYYCGFPSWPMQVGPFNIDVMYGLIMIALLAISLAFTFWGGQIAVMVTDFIQGMFINIVFVVLGIYMLFFLFDWQVIVDAAIQYAPEDASLLNPMKTSGTDNFNFNYFLISAFGSFYAYMAWQGSQGYFSSARSPHDARMGRVVGQLRNITQTLPLALLPVCAYAFLHHPDFATQAAGAHAILDSVESDQIRSQLTVTVASSQFLPVGILGLFAAVMLAAFISTHDTYLHSWGSIFIQDIVMPIRQNRVGDKVMESATHIRWLRFSIIGVVIFIFLFSLLFSQQQDILMFFALTGTIYLGWAGSCIIGGLYWKRGTTGGAWAATIGGIILAFIGWYMTYNWASFQAIMAGNLTGLWAWLTTTWPEMLGDSCPITAQVLFFWTMIACMILYAGVSLLQRQEFDMDRLLHRGEDQSPDAKQEAPKRGWAIFKLGHEFTTGDRVLFFGSYAYIFLFFAVFFIGTVYMLSTDISDQAWGEFWWYFCIAILFMTAAITVWVSIGGIRNLKEMFAMLSSLQRNEADDGTVVGHQSLADLQETPPKET